MARCVVGCGTAVRGAVEPLLDGPFAAPPAIASNWSSLPGFTLHGLELYAQAEALMRRVVAAARVRCAVTLPPIPLAVLAYVELRTGATAAAHADASDAVRLARDVGDGMQYSSAQSVLAWVEAVRGRGAECRAAADRDRRRPRYRYGQQVAQRARRAGVRRTR